jgi:hypothetical protein
MKVKPLLQDFYGKYAELMSGFILDKTIAVNSPKRMEGVKILIANTCEPSSLISCILVTNQGLQLAMDTDKVKIFGARVKVDGTGKLAELERAEKVRTSSNPRNTHILIHGLGKNESKSRSHRNTWHQLFR